MTKTRNNQNRVCLGAVVGVHGIKGEVKVKSWTSADTDIDRYGKLENEDGSRLFELKVVGRSKELLRCKIKGVDDRNAAEALVGTALYVKRDVLPELAEEEYYQTDLIGLDVLEQSSAQTVGQVAGFYNFGAGDILEIKLSATGKTELIPFTRQYVPEIDIANGKVIVSAAITDFVADEERTGDEN